MTLQTSWVPRWEYSQKGTNADSSTLRHQDTNPIKNGSCGAV